MHVGKAPFSFTFGACSRSMLLLLLLAACSICANKWLVCLVAGEKVKRNSRSSSSSSGGKKGNRLHGARTALTVSALVVSSSASCFIDLYLYFHLRLHSHLNYLSCAPATSSVCVLYCCLFVCLFVLLEPTILCNLLFHSSADHQSRARMMSATDAAAAAVKLRVLIKLAHTKCSALF